jgi:hypothetical protein|tara:strand:+ start:200 stop:1048 length:849 start_codon:yes stop_codon:yes gene_type:complete
MLDFNSQDYSFPVEVQPVFTEEGNEIPNHKCIVRTDTGDTLGLHGSQYKMIPHDDVVNSIIDGVSAANLSTDYEVKVDVIDNGRKIRGEIVFGDIIQQPSVGDIIKYRISFFNSYDGSWAFAQKANALRLWCLNGCTTPDLIASSRFKHTASVDVLGSADKVISGADHFMNRAEEWQSWMKSQLNDDQAESFFRSTLCKVTTKQKQVEKTNERQLENLLSGWNDEIRLLGRNKWALYNCLTSWATHTNDLRAPQVARYNREAAISNAMRHNLWTSMNEGRVI